MDEGIDHIVIDRTFVDEEGIRWIIDYKASTTRAAIWTNSLTGSRNATANNSSGMRTSWPGWGTPDSLGPVLSVVEWLAEWAFAAD